MKKLYIAVALAAVLAGGYYTTRRFFGEGKPSGTALVSGENAGPKKFSDIAYSADAATEKSYRRGVEFAERDLKSGDIKLYHHGSPEELNAQLKKLYSSELGIMIEEWGIEARPDELAFMKGYNSTVERQIELIFGGEVWTMVYDEFRNSTGKDNLSELDK